MLATRSRLTKDDAGWTWLEPEGSSLTIRHAIVSLILSLLLVASAAAASLPPPVVAVPSFALIVGVGALIVRGVWRETHTRLGVSAFGLLLQQGTQQDQVGWPVVVAVMGTRRGRRLRVAVTTRTGDIPVHATFSRDPARQWLVACIDHAAARRLDPQPAPEGAGFIAGDAASR